MEFLVEEAIKNSENMTSNTQVGQANIKVIGCGGGGSNMVNWLSKKGIQGAKTIACNTDKAHLDTIQADSKILIGRNLTRGLGCGGYPQKGAEAAEESNQELKEALQNCDLVFVCAGMGGGTGTGSAPFVAKTAREQGAIVLGTVTMPFKIERARIDKAEFGLKDLRKECDTVIVIDNNRLVEIAGNLPVQQAFAVANELISTMIRGIVETIAVPSLVNLDFADVKAIMTNGGVAAIGVGSSDTASRIDEAVKGAMSNPLLDISYKGATGALIQVEGGPDMTLEEVEKIGNLVTENLDEDANVIWGARINEQMEGKVTVITIMTGVKSPSIVGKETSQEEVKSTFNDTLGLEMV
jgi:cell division protein FtsZ